MARIAYFRRKSGWLVFGVGAVAVAVWATYAWKFAEYSNGAGTAAHERISLAQDADTNSKNSLTTLRATRRPKKTMRAPDLFTSVRPNSPASIEDAVEMVMGRPEDEHPVLPEPTISALSNNPTQPSRAGTADSSVLSSARAALDQGDLVVARSEFTKALDGELPQADADSIRDELAGLAEAMLFSRASNVDDPLTNTHVVQSGESLYVLAKRHKITQKLLASINQITNPNRIRSGSRLKTIQGPFNAVVWKSQHRMDIYLGDTYVRSFRVGLGTDGSTPSGHWIVKTKLENPDWIDPNTGRHYLANDPNNPIGERWVGLKCIDGECLGREGFGIHGTIEPESIGADMSMGCVRLAQGDVELVYDLLVRQHSRVEVRP
ncbi:MAG: L,D-transpeptidase family protein [Phycisphaerales bacterium]|nr:L,D-transpeptidase family protein [Phycisphaerales bacterium]